MSASVGSILGTVVDSQTKRGLSGVSVKIVETGQTAVSNAKGDFHIKKVAPGKYKVKLVLKGFKPQTLSKIIVKEGLATTLNATMEPVQKEANWKGLAKNRIRELFGEDEEKKDQTSKEKIGTDRSNNELPASLARPTTEDAEEESVESLENEEVAAPEALLDLKAPEPTPPPAVEFWAVEDISPEQVEALRKEREERRARLESEAVDRDNGLETSEEKLEPTSEREAAEHTALFLKGDYDKPEVSTSESISPPKKPRPRPKQASGLKASYADDNQQFNYFLNFLNKYESTVNCYIYNISERIHLQFVDSNKKSLPNLKVEILDKKQRKVLEKGKTYPDGSFFFYPSEATLKDKTFQVAYTINDVRHTLEIQRDGPRNIEIVTGQPRQLASQIPVDIVFILDTTGSMGEEIKRLIETIDLIHMNLSLLSDQATIRFGMVLYRDKEDRYRTQVVPLTSDIDEFRSALEKVEAGGGGDTAEDLQAALEKGMHDIDWNQEGVRLGFIITDAHAHLDYRQKYTYLSAALEAKRKGIKLFSVGTGGLGIRGEYILRQISQLTYAKYLFLTYGDETGENTGGVAGSVSHHTGSNYQTDKLEAIIMRMAKEEMSNFTEKPFEPEEDYFQADKVDFETREVTLAKLFKDAVSRLIDYSTLRIDKSKPLGVLPIHAIVEESELSAEYFTAQVQLSVAENKQFTLIARKNLQAVLEEQKLQLSGLLTDDQTTRIGELLGAELLLSGELYKKDGGYDLFLKLLRVETAEILAVTKIVIDEDLGL